MAGLNMREATTAKVRKPKKVIDHIRVAEAENGGHTAYHHHTSEFEHPPEGPHIFPAHGGNVPVLEGHLFHHLAKHLGIPHDVVAPEAKAEQEPEDMEEHEMEAGE
jgi:hypothetical protein